MRKRELLILLGGSSLFCWTEAWGSQERGKVYRVGIALSGGLPPILLKNSPAQEAMKY